MERPGCFNIKACIIFMDSDILIAGQCSNSSYCLVFLVFYAMACVLHKFMNIALGLYPKLVGSMSTGNKQKLLFSSLRTSSHPKVSQNQFYFFYLSWKNKRKHHFDPYILRLRSMWFLYFVSSQFGHCYFQVTINLVFTIR